MSELTKYLVHNYNNMSKKSKSETGLTYNPACLEDYRQCVVDAQSFEDEQPTLNENQQIVLEWLKEDESQFFKEALGDFYFYDHHGYRISETYEQLSEKEFAQVIEVFSKWAQEQEEE